MSDWSEKQNGNFVYVIDTDEVMCVYPNKTFGGWTGRMNDTFLKGSYDSAEEAQDAMESLFIDGKTELGRNADSGWKASKKGGYYRQNSHGIVTVKQARTGNWYMTSNGELVKGHWFNSAEDAKLAANEYLK